MPQTYLPPKAAQANAKEALKVRAEKPSYRRGMTEVGLARARDLSNGKALSLDTLKRMKAYFDRHEGDKQGSTWSDQGKGWQAWQGWGGDEARDWVERILANIEHNITVRKVALVDIQPAKLRKMRSDELRLAWLRLNQWYSTAKQTGKAIEDYVNAARWVVAEFNRRGFKVDSKLPLAVEASKLSKAWVEAQFDNLPEDMVVVNDFISVVGSVAKGRVAPNDLDVLVRSEMDCDTNLLIKSENAWLPVRNALNPEKQHEIQFIYNAQGSHGDYIPLYDLVLRRRKQPETKIVKACYGLEDFLADQDFELEGDNFSDKGPATGTVIGTDGSGKIVVEFDEPQTFDLEDIGPYLQKTDRGWFVKSSPTAESVHVPSTMNTQGKKKINKDAPLRIDLGCGNNKKQGFTGIDVNKDVNPDMVYDLSQGIPYEDGTVDEVNASHFLEHCANPTQIMGEIHRVLKPGGVLSFEVPSTRGEGAFAHPAHVSFWNKSSFAFWTNPEFIEDRPQFDVDSLEEVGEGDRINVVGQLRKPVAAPDQLTKALQPFTPFIPPKPKMAGITESFDVADLKDWAKDRYPIDIEPKWNGFRVIVERKSAQLRMWTEGQHDKNLLPKLPTLETELRRISGDWILDADLGIEKDGKRLPRPELMRLNRDTVELSDREKLVLTVFDLPYYHEDLSDKPFSERRTQLEELKVFNENIKLSPARWAQSDKDLDKLTKWAFSFDRSEGLVAKEGSSKYPKGATSSWAKLKIIVELKVKVLDTKSVKGGGRSYLGGLTLSQGDNWDNVTDGNVVLGWSLNSRVPAKVGDIITVSILELVPDKDSNKLTWLGANVLDVDTARTKPYSSGQAMGIAERGGVLQKMEDFIDNAPSCYFCSQDSVKVITYGEGENTLFTCSQDLIKGIEYVNSIDSEGIESVLDVDEYLEAEEEDCVKVKVKVKVSKKLDLEGDITRESVAAKFWEDNWDKLYPKSGIGRFVFQHHWRGLSKEETSLSEAELLKTDHSVHGDLRFEADDGLWGFSVFIGTTEANRAVGGDKLIAAKDDTNIRGTFKLRQPYEWLNVGVRKPYVSEPGGVGATSQRYAVFHALDHGTYDVGVRNRHFVEVFIHGSKLKGRYIIASMPIGGGERAWVIKKPADQTPYAESHDLDKEVEDFKKRGHKELLWAKPGMKPQLIDLTQKQEYSVNVLKADGEKRLVTGIVLEPDTLDAHNDTVSAAEIEKAAYSYMQTSQKLGMQHKEKADGVKIVESYIAPTDFNLGDQKVKKGSWVMTVKVLSNDKWKKIKEGKITGFSIGGYGMRRAS